MLTVLPLDTNGFQSRQGKSFTTLPSVEILEIVRLLGIRVLILQRWGSEAIEEKIVQSACIYHLGHSSCMLKRFQRFIASVIISSIVVILARQIRPHCVILFSALTNPLVGVSLEPSATPSHFP